MISFIFRAVPQYWYEDQGESTLTGGDDTYDHLLMIRPHHDHLLIKRPQPHHDHLLMIRPHDNHLHDHLLMIQPQPHHGHLLMIRPQPHHDYPVITQLILIMIQPFDPHHGTAAWSSSRPSNYHMYRCPILLMTIQSFWQLHDPNEIQSWHRCMTLFMTIQLWYDQMILICWSQIVILMEFTATFLS